MNHKHLTTDELEQDFKNFEQTFRWDTTASSHVIMHNAQVCLKRLKALKQENEQLRQALEKIKQRYAPDTEAWAMANKALQHNQEGGK